ncbi:MAG: hypothetical protein FWG57_06950 [Endomicrobia bacterium]|nr:hypothetical protein [Endomicrobiia bacterium]
MVKKIAAVLLVLSIICCGAAFAGLQKRTLYAPPSEKQFRELKEIFPNFSDKDMEKSIKLAREQENIDIINNILAFLQYKNLIKQTKKLPPIFMIYSDNNGILAYNGGMYSDNKNIILLNANMLMANSAEQNKMPKHMQDAIDFVAFASILSHELMHYEDFASATEIRDADSFVLSELKAYKRSEKTLEYFLNMSEAEADEIIPIRDFYKSIRMFEEYFTDMRKNYIKMADAAKIFLNNENKIRKTFGIDENMFKMLPFYPQLQFNVKNGGHIVRTESNLLNIAQPLKFNINILTGNLDILNTPQEIEAIKKQAKNIKVIDKNSYIIIR